MMRSRLLPLLFVGSGLSQYFGSAVAVGLFVLFGPAETAWLRGAAGALVMVLWRRSWRKSARPQGLKQWGATALFGVMLLGMNTSFYIAIAHLPMGTAVAIEFIGPIMVAALLGRRASERLAVGLAAAGVVLLAFFARHPASALAQTNHTIGLIAIFVAATAWAGYIVVGQKIASSRNGLDSLAWSLVIAVILYFPFIGPHTANDWRTIVAGHIPENAGTIAVSLVIVAIGITALCTTVIPYSLEQIVMRNVSAAVFSILLAMLPAMATVVGVLFLRQVPSVIELLGLVLVTAAVVLTARPRIL